MELLMNIQRALRQRVYDVYLSASKYPSAGLLVLINCQLVLNNHQKN